MARTRQRPRRGGGGNVLVTGDTGIAAGPQGGARPGASESGDLDAREFGVPQADIPGGVRHVVNPQTRAARPGAAPERPADYHKEHGVPPEDWGGYGTPGDEELLREQDVPRPAPLPHEIEAVPVYEVEAPGKKLVIRTLATKGPFNIPANDSAPRRIADRDPSRLAVYIKCEDNAFAQGLRVGSKEDVDQGLGIFCPGNATSWQEIKTQDDLWAVNSRNAAAGSSGVPSTSAVNYSVGLLTEIEAAGL